MDITQEYLKSIIDYDSTTGKFKSIKRNAIIGGINCNGYLVIRLGGKDYYGHRLAWLYTYGEWPKGHIDHINRVPSDNRLVNLRLANHSVNAINTGLRTTNTSGHKGITWNKKANKWLAQIVVNYKYKYLGIYSNLDDAVEAYNNAAKTLHGINI